MPQGKKLTVGQVTHVVTDTNEDSATMVVEALQAGSGSDKCPRQFGDWEEFPGGRQSIGTIAGKPVTLVVGHVSEPSAQLYVVKSGSMGKRVMRPRTKEAIVNSRIDDVRATSLAGQLAASLFFHGHVGMAPDPDKPKKQKRGRRGRRSDVMGGFYGCYGCYD